jgi:hypothetical protein
METTSSNKRTTIIILIVTALIIGGAVIVAQQNKSGTTAKTNTTQKQPAISSSPKTAVNSSSSNFKQGTYNATGNYQSPGGGQQIKVSITLNSDGTITDSSAQGDNHADDSRIYQARFIEGYKDQVVGKKISDIKLSQVSGSSLTSIGFNNALETIKNQAKA